MPREPKKTDDAKPSSRDSSPKRKPTERYQKAKAMLKKKTELKQKLDYLMEHRDQLEALNNIVEALGKDVVRVCTNCICHYLVPKNGDDQCLNCSAAGFCTECRDAHRELCAIKYAP